MKKLDFTPRVNYVGNVFHFISNLTCWHFSCRKFYNEFWLQETGPLSKKESDALEKAATVFKKYNFGENYWGKTFLRYSDDLVWQKAKEVFRDDYEEFEKLFKIFEPRFQKLWSEDKNLLEKWAGRLKVISFLLSSPGLTADLDAFFGSRDDSATIEIILLVNSPGTSASGGSNLGPGVVTLELSRTPFNYLRPVILTMWHEIVHSVWQTDKYQKMKKKIAAGIKTPSPIKGVAWEELINEAVTESLFDHGYLAEKHFGFPSQEYFAKKLSLRNARNHKMSYWRDYSASKLSPLAKDYIEKKKPIDMDFLREVASLTKTDSM